MCTASTGRSPGAACPGPTRPTTPCSCRGATCSSWPRGCCGATCAGSRPWPWRRWTATRFPTPPPTSSPRVRPSSTPASAAPCACCCRTGACPRRRCCAAGGGCRWGTPSRACGPPAAGTAGRAISAASAAAPSPPPACPTRRPTTGATMYSVTRELSFCYGHRLLNYDGKCRHLHGHNGRAVLTLAAPTLDRLGMVADFSTLKRVVGGWIDQALDHRMLLHKDDPVLPLLRQLGEPVFVLDANPTAENIARLIYDYAAGQGFPVVEVRLWETDSCFASYAAPGGQRPAD